MFGHQFYPTPEHLIKKMLKYYPVHEHHQLWSHHGPKRILEPSAGSGAILDFMVKHMDTWKVKDREFHACEIDAELNAMLHGKGYTVVGSDFLEFRTEQPYDLIIMNPPFDAAAEHIVHAYEFLHGELVALCNAETVRNPRGDHGRRLAQLIAQGGKVEYVGQPFLHAARPTDVEVALIRLKRSQDSEVPNWWSEAELKFEDAVDLNVDNLTANGVVRYDHLDSVVNGYAAARKAFRDLLVARERLDRAVRPYVRAGKDPVKEALDVYVGRDEAGQAANIRDRHFGMGMQKSAWASILAQTNLRDYATAGVRRNLNSLLEQQQALVFDKANIASMLELLFVNRGELLRQALVETFDRLCSYFDGNHSHWEGWKTNAAHMVRRKVILPRCGLSYDARFGSFSCYDMSTDDIDRTMAMLEGRKLSDATRMEHLVRGRKAEDVPRLVTIQQAVSSSINDLRKPVEHYHWREQDNTAESEYFLIRYWKKGTVHLYFKDEDLWARFNQEGARGKGWLPFNPDHVPTPKTTATERRAMKELEEIAEPKRARMLQKYAGVPDDPGFIVQ